MTMSTILRFVTADGDALFETSLTSPSDDHIDLPGVVSLDDAGVPYKVVGSRVQGDQTIAVVEPYGEPDAATVRPFHPSAPTRATVPSTDGVELALHQLGGSGPDLIICHATGFHGLAYAPLARALAASFTVWAIDFRGHGASTAPASGDFAWTGMAQDLLTCVDEIGSGSVRAVGHSLGGAAILLAELARPGTIDGAYLFEPIAFPKDHLASRKANPMSGPARRRREVFESRRAALERYNSRPPLNELRLDALAAYVEHGFVDLADGSVTLACRPEHEARTFESDEKLTIDRLDGLAIPLWVGAGRSDGSPGPAAFAPMIAAAVSGARLIDYEDLGHFGPLEDPDRIAADIIDAFRG